jgi:hypothetical protein
MTKRPPDSRVPFGQAIEDRLDAVTESMRRDTAKWLERQMRAAPGDTAMKAAMVGGIAAALLDELWKAAAGAEQILPMWNSYAESYLAAQAEDEAADAEAGPEARP